MPHPLDQIRTNLAKLEAVAARFPSIFTEDNVRYISCPTYHKALEVHMADAALVGDVVGKTGWVRRVTGKDYNWEQKFDDVTLILVGVEQVPGNDTPVPPKSFPLQLQ